MLNKLWEWIKRPHGWLLIPFYILTAVVVAGAILSTFFLQGTNDGFIAYLFYFLAAITFGYTVYTVVIFIPKAKGKIISLLQRYSFTNQLMEQFGFRTIIFAIVSFVISIGYVIINGTIGILEFSIWYGALAAYYLVLAVMRGNVLLFHRTKKRKQTGINDERERAIKSYRWCGIGLIFLPICLSFAILQMVIGKNSFEHSGLMIYVSATYTFYKIMMSVVNVFKARKEDDITVRAVRSVNLADAMVSILALQTAMFKEFASDQSVGIVNAVTGGVVCALTFALGVFVIVNANLKLKNLQKEITNERTE